MNNFDFYGAMGNKLNDRMVKTENGANAYATAGKKILDFNFAINALRRTPDDIVQDLFADVYFENPLDAFLELFFMRDARGGSGERKIFRSCLRWLAENKPEPTKHVISLVNEYGRFDDLWCLLDTELKSDVIKYVKNKLNDDVKKMNNNGHPSLLAKWMPSENASSKTTRRYFHILRNGLGISERRYRKTIAKLRKYLDVLEVKMTSKRWNEIDYSTVPSQANLKYEAAFMRNDKERREEYLNSLKNGETKINARVLQPHEIVRRYNPSSRGWGDVGSSYVNPYDETLEQLWKALPDITVENCLVIRDGSGSMTCGYDKVRPLDVASALSIYMSEHNNGFWKDKFITFGNKPKIVNLENCSSLRDKLLLAYKYADCSNTNIEATMMLILTTALDNHCTKEDMPSSILIVSDMRFDQGCEHANQSLFDYIAEEYRKHGYKMPKIVFWNVNEAMSEQTIPMKQNELGVVLISGYSPQLLKMVMSNEIDPYKVLLETLHSKRYLPVREAVEDLV